MNWSDERFVRVYTRDTADWLALRWEAKALAPLLLRKADRSGVVQVATGPTRARRVAGLVGLPADIVELGLEDLLADGCLIETDLGFTFRNYIEAQETPQSDAQRQRESRARRRELGTNDRYQVTKRDEIGSQNVTEGHELSRGVTPSLSEPIRAEPIGSVAAQSATPVPDVPTVTRMDRRKRERPAPDPLHAQLVAALVEDFEEGGQKYGFDGGKDAAAVKRLLSFSRDVDEHRRRWRIARSLLPPRGVRSIALFAMRWNEFSAGPAATSKDLTRGYARASAEFDPDEFNAANKREVSHG